MDKYLIIRMLGNDIPGLHGSGQTLNNLKFTLENEKNFNDTKKIYVLNRIVDSRYEYNLIKLLDEYNKKYITIPFCLKTFNKIEDKNIPYDEYVNFTRENKVKTMLEYNLYLVNNNSCRNFCVNYGKKKGYKWIFLLDSNNFFTEKSFQNIIDNIDDSIDYIIIPQKRIKDGGFINDDILKINESLIDNLESHEPQIAFNNTSKLYFNEDIPYGIAPKAEFLNALDVKGKWNKWTNYCGLNIKQRNFNNVKFKTISKIIRLHPMSVYNDYKKNWDLRWIGLFKLKELIKQNKLGGYKKNKNRNRKKYKTKNKKRNIKLKSRRKIFKSK